ncbi:MAG: SDR family oxidoreductase [Burkholderiales bacterium]|nr:SDR family oxidoreductase [Burkholderiales bacterium]
MNTPNTSPRVLVVGASGALGQPVIRQLLARGVAVRGLCRHPEAAAALAAAGAEIVAGDLTDRASLERALAGVTRVLAAAHGLLGRGRWRSEAVDDAGHRDLIAAARAAGVDRFVYVSALMATPDHPIDFARTKHGIEQALAASGLPHAVLRPTAFMEHHVHRFNGLNVLAKGKAQLIGPGTKQRNFVAAADVAQFAVRALLDEPLPFTQLEVGGPDHASNGEVAALYARLAGKPLKVSHLPAGVARALSALARPLHPGVARLLHLTSLPDSAFSETWQGGAELEARFGIRLTRLEEFVAAQVRAHGAAPSA